MDANVTLGEQSDTGYPPLATEFVQVNMQYGRICGFGGIPQGRIDVLGCDVAGNRRRRRSGNAREWVGGSGGCRIIVINEGV